MVASDFTTALQWIVDLLHEREVSFYVTGDLAAHAYNSKHPFRTIDLEVPEDRIAHLMTSLRPYITGGPGPFEDDTWRRSLFITLSFEDVQLTIGGASHVFLHNRTNGAWVPVAADASLVEECKVLGITLPVLARAALNAREELLAAVPA